MLFNKLKRSYEILDDLRLDHGLYLASPSTDYSYVWLRDSFYEVLPYLNDESNKYEVTYHRILDMLKEYEWKLDIHSVQKPMNQWEYIHARYDASTVTEIDSPWGHAQHDSIGAILFGIAKGIQAGKPIIRDLHDTQIIQKVVNYLDCCKYWEDEDNGMWEEHKEVHMSSVGAVVAGLREIKSLNIVTVPEHLIVNGLDTVHALFPFESKTKPVDLAQLSLIYPYNIFTKEESEEIVYRVETLLTRTNGVIRYQGDSYYSTIENKHGRELDPKRYYGTEAEWTFGIPWLALCNLQLGHNAKAFLYINWSEHLMTDDGSLPELYFANSKDYNGNTPLGWANAMYILAKEENNKLEPIVINQKVLQDA